MSFSGKMTRISTGFTIGTVFRMTMSVWVHPDARSPIRSCFSSGRILQKITQQKDARIRVLFDERFCQVFPDVVKGAPDLRFHVGKQWGDLCLTGSSRKSLTESASDTDHNPKQVPACYPKYTDRHPSLPGAFRPYHSFLFHVVNYSKYSKKTANTR